jgi:hypothetical protein
MEANNMNPNDAHDAHEANNEANNDANIHAVYAVAIPASVPVANAAAALHVTDAPAIEANAPVVLDDLIASIREVESRKRFNLSPPEVSPITSGEVALSTVREFVLTGKYVASQHAVMPDAPLWAQQMHDALAHHVRERVDALGHALGQRVDALANRVDELTDEIRRNHTDADLRFRNDYARNMNRLAIRYTDALTPLVARDGQGPPGFPQSRLDFGTLTDEAVTNLLQFYGLPFEFGDDRVITLRRLCHFTGIPE